LDFTENGVNYKEKITVDENADTIEYEVPRHGKVQAIKYLDDIKSVSCFFTSLKLN